MFGSFSINSFSSSSSFSLFKSGNTLLPNILPLILTSVSLLLLLSIISLSVVFLLTGNVNGVFLLFVFLLTGKVIGFIVLPPFLLFVSNLSVFKSLLPIKLDIFLIIFLALFLLILILFLNCKFNEFKMDVNNENILFKNIPVLELLDFSEIFSGIYVFNFSIIFSNSSYISSSSFVLLVSLFISSNLFFKSNNC